MTNCNAIIFSSNHHGPAGRNQECLVKLLGVRTFVYITLHLHDFPIYLPPGYLAYIA
jgi:hypothetical protein